MVKRVSAFISVLILVGSTVVLAQNSQHQRACSNHTAKGAYGYSCLGVAPNPFDSFKVEPFAAYGVVTSDGNGQWDGNGKVSFNGAVAPWVHNTRQSEPSKVNADCTGSVTYEVSVGGSAVPDAHFEFVIVDEGREVKGFPMDAGYAVSCQLILEKNRSSR